MPDIVPWQNPRTDPNPYARLGAALRVWGPALLWAAFIFVMSTDAFSAQHTASFFDPILKWLKPDITRHQLMLANHYIRKTAHFTEYFVFCLLLYRGVRGARIGWHWRWGLTAWFIAFCYAALDEVHQAFVASREARVSDSLLDSFGALVATVALFLLLRKNRLEPAEQDS
jgi:VanZ family protein